MRAVGVLFLHTMREIEAFGIFQMIFFKQICNVSARFLFLKLDPSTWIFSYVYLALFQHRPFHWSVREDRFIIWRA